ncbi:MAG: hypothetical protein QOF28_1581 [Actinomycetota bacterium]|nr:hypothetical protein [Actinomycetota bacterium]
MGFRCEKRASPVTTAVARCCGLALLMFALVACGIDHPSPVRVGGTLRMVGGRRPVGIGVAGVVSAVPSTGPRITATAGPNGTFSMQLAPGVYHFVGRSPGYLAANYDCVADRPVKLVHGSLSGVNVDCAIR